MGEPDDNMLTPDESAEVGKLLDNPFFKDGGKFYGNIKEITDAMKDIVVEEGPKWLSDAAVGAKIPLEEERNNLETWLGGLLREENVPSEVVTEILQAIKGFPLGGWIGNKIMTALLGLQVYGKFMGSIMEAVGEFKTKQWNKILRPHPGDLYSLLTWNWRRGNPVVFEELIGELGIQKNWEPILLEAAKSIPNASEILELTRRGDISLGDANKYMKWQGYQDDDVRGRLLGLRRSLVPIDTAQELFRRGKIDRTTIEGIIQEHGLQSPNYSYLSDLSYNILPLPVAIDQYFRQGWDAATFEDRASKVGYLEDEAKHIIHSAQAMLTVWDVTKSMHRGMRDHRETHDYLRKLRYTGQDADDLIRMSYVLPTPTDLVRFGVREVYTPEIAELFGQYENYPKGMTKWGKLIGMQEDVLQMYWAAHWNLPPATQGFDMMHRGIIDVPQLRLLLRALDIMPFWRDKVIQLSYRLIPRRMIMRMLRDDVISHEEAFTRYRALGYAPDDAATMIQYDKEDEGPTVRTLTRADIMNGIRRGYLSNDEGLQGLRNLQYTQPAAAYYVWEANRRKTEDERTNTQDTDTATVAEARELTKADVLGGFRDGLLDEDAARELLTSINYSSEAIGYLLAREKLSQFVDNLREQAKQFKRQFDAGLTESADVSKQLIYAGYVPLEAEKMVRRWQAERDTDIALKQVRDRLPTRAVLNKWLDMGIIRPGTWRDYMGQLGYGKMIIDHFLQAYKEGEKE